MAHEVNGEKALQNPQHRCAILIKNRATTPFGLIRRRNAIHQLCDHKEETFQDNDVVGPQRYEYAELWRYIRWKLWNAAVSVKACRLIRIGVR
jgi:hypothetical protein